MSLKHTVGNKFEGVYRTAVGVPKPEDEFKLFGTFVDCKSYVILSWTVNWQPKANSIAAWTGTAINDKEGIKIVANFHLNRACNP